MKNHFVPGIEPLPIIIIISRIWARIWPWERGRGKKGEMGGWFWRLRDNGVYGTTPMTLDRADINGLLPSLGRCNPWTTMDLQRHGRNERNGYHFCTVAVDINALFPGRRWFLINTCYV